MLRTAASVMSPNVLKLLGMPEPSDCAVLAPLLLARVASVRLNRSPGCAVCAAWIRRIRSVITACDWPPSMSKSTPIRPGVAQRPRKVSKPAFDPQVNEPAAPPVARMYLMPAALSCDAFAAAIAAPGTPPQLSLPHSPVANARVIVLLPFAGRSLTSGVAVPGTIVEMTLVFQFMLMLVSL